MVSALMQSGVFILAQEYTFILLHQIYAVPYAITWHTPLQKYNCFSNADRNNYDWSTW